MKTSLPALVVLGILAFAGPADAFTVDEDLVAVTAMPLAVADVTALPDIPQSDVMTVVTTLNQAAVPAPQFVEIVRYVPVALVQPAEPRFTTYVTQQYQSGVIGEPLAVAIADRYDAYGIEHVDIADPPVLTVVEQREILPPVVVTRFQRVDVDPLALIAMPLAVAAVADIAGVPQNDLMRLVASLNQALVPAPQFVEVVRYSPVVLTDQTASPQFLQFVTTEVDRGVLGRPLAFEIAERIETVEPVDINVIEPRPALAPMVVTREARAHPHGGPPGQLKKQLRLQTGAEVVHGTSPRRVARKVSQKPPRMHAARVREERHPQKVLVVRPAAPRAVAVQAQPKAHGHGGGKGQGQNKGKGKGKG
ncbi:MAG TPA: hypothetical protein VKB93_27145 [Thermoanaerobaculia bacterium]|nr:hypothetical protein [Thermoanaerobaculia bacterium]